MPFNRRIPYGLSDLKDWIITQIGNAKTSLQSWCTGKFSLLGHTHDNYANKIHNHAISDVTNLQSTLNSKAATNHTHSTYALTSHTHPQSDITNLVTALAGKASTSHTHIASQISGLDTAVKTICIGFPDYSNMTDPISTTTYEVSANGYVCTLKSAEKCTTIVKVNGKDVGVIGGWENSHGLHMFLPVSDGDIVTFSKKRSMVFIPCK